ncbi:RNA polymerase sigma factor [Spongiactinospora sp. TRM90649]|uniref:RNA polymerase sigma factor n=1 Tax=Spongiactinospora sp. TRM90649 TaxID=3031114 RepID=UPI0023FA2E6A|nr:RNA polymerase sigma factor [Spongiactinospora sp. TRM90649]MDF5751170.1 RNA polymerase sigma factor [Spongiactinospora sp. TRM90649]
MTIETAELDDAELIRRSAGDPEQFAALFDRYARHIHRYAARRIGAQAADDIVAETFLTAFRRRSSYDTAFPMARPWLYGIATTLVARHRRQEERMLRALSRTGHDPLPEPEADAVLSRVAALDKERELAAALAGMARGDRDVLLLVAWEDFSYEEVARALGIPLGTVRSRLHRARRKARAVLGDDEELG